MTTVLLLSDSFIIISLFSCISFETCFCLGESLFCAFAFSRKLIFKSFSKNMVNSLLLYLFRKNLDLFLTRESSVFS